MDILNIVTSPRKEQSASSAIVNAFLSEYRAHVGNVTVDTLDIWQEQLPEFDAEAAGHKYLLGRAGLLNLHNARLAIERLQAAFGDGGSHKNDECACWTADLIATASPHRY